MSFCAELWFIVPPLCCSHRSRIYSSSFCPSYRSNCTIRTYPSSSQNQQPRSSAQKHHSRGGGPPLQHDDDNVQQEEPSSSPPHIQHNKQATRKPQNLHPAEDSLEPDAVNARRKELKELQRSGESRSPAALDRRESLSSNSPAHSAGAALHNKMQDVQTRLRTDPSFLCCNKVKLSP